MMQLNEIDSSKEIDALEQHLLAQLNKMNKPDIQKMKQLQKEIVKKQKELHELQSKLNEFLVETL